MRPNDVSGAALPQACRCPAYRLLLPAANHGRRGVETLLEKLIVDYCSLLSFLLPLENFWSIIDYLILLNLAGREFATKRKARADCGCAFFVFDFLIIVISPFSILSPCAIISFRHVHTEYTAVFRSLIVAQPWQTWRVNIRCWRSWEVSLSPVFLPGLVCSELTW